MRKVLVFNQVTIDGFIADANSDMSWAHKARQSDEWNKFADDNATGGGVLLFGRKTYDLMKGFWPSPQAAAQFPVLSERMNNMEKIVFSRTLNEATWTNTTLIKEDLATAVRNLKQQPGDDMVILGSGSIVAQLAQHGLIDEYQVVVNPVVLGAGKSMFEGLKKKLELKLISSRAFNNGNVVLCYQPEA